jgi:HlyD family secretion protein
MARKGDSTTNSSVKATSTNSSAVATKDNIACTNGAAAAATNGAKGDRKSKDKVRPIEVVFLMDGDHARMVPVKIGISDDSYWEITEGLEEGQDVVSGGYRAINKDLEDGKKIKKGTVGSEGKDGEKKSNES